MGSSPSGLAIDEDSGDLEWEDEISDSDAPGLSTTGPPTVSATADDINSQNLLPLLPRVGADLASPILRDLLSTTPISAPNPSPPTQEPLQRGERRPINWDD